MINRGEFLRFARCVFIIECMLIGVENRKRKFGVS